MTVQELIDQLQAVQDKTMAVIVRRSTPHSADLFAPLYVGESDQIEIEVEKI